jgi:hypothetical protein
MNAETAARQLPPNTKFWIANFAENGSNPAERFTLVINARGSGFVGRVVICGGATSPSVKIAYTLK